MQTNDLLLLLLLLIINGHSLRRACLQPATNTQNSKPRPPTTNAEENLEKINKTLLETQHRLTTPLHTSRYSARFAQSRNTSRWYVIIFNNQYLGAALNAIIVARRKPHLTLCALHASRATSTTPPTAPGTPRGTPLLSCCECGKRGIQLLTSFDGWGISIKSPGVG